MILMYATMEEQWLILIKLIKIEFHHIQKDITNFDNYINVHLHTNSNSSTQSNVHY